MGVRGYGGWGLGRKTDVGTRLRYSYGVVSTEMQSGDQYQSL